MPREMQQKDSNPRSPNRLGWERHWDPHPVCWLESALSAPPYRWASLGMRSCPDGGVALTFPGTQLMVGAGPVDRHRVTWSVHTHDPVEPETHEPIEFGSFVWIRLDGARYDEEASLLRLPDGSTLDVADRRGRREVRYRIGSRVQPSRLIAGTGSWADLAAVEQAAARVHDWLTDLAGRAG